MIAYFWEREDAALVAERLGGDVLRGRFHGEDDDEDHPWGVVLADVDRPTLDALLVEYDGWLEEDNARPRPGTVPEAPPLPTEPKRFKR
ncbi:MAG TPA: hypothetical protein VG497_09780 [Kribbella sp.]|nr:hypothetical protein [Kribbella sp.]